MITAELKPMPDLLKMLKGHRRILIAGCACCAAECAAGGKREVETLAPLLKLALAKEGETVEITARVPERQCEWEFVDGLAEDVKNADAVLSLACGIGVQALAERYPKTPVYPGVNTTALAIRQEDGLWLARCAACGDCVLDETFGICPIARCSKSLMNGPCGGTREGGKCELDCETDCAWAKIVERAKELGKLDKLAEPRKPKDWSSSRHGGPRRIERKDLRP